MPSRDLCLYLLTLVLLVCVTVWMRFDAAAATLGDLGVLRDEATLLRLRELGARSLHTGHLTWPMDAVLWLCESVVGSDGSRTPRAGIFFAGPLIAGCQCFAWALLAGRLLGGRWAGCWAAGLFSMAVPVVFETAAGNGADSGLTTMLVGLATLSFLLGLKRARSGDATVGRVTGSGRRPMFAAGVLLGGAVWAGAAAGVVLILWALFAAMHVTVSGPGRRDPVVALHLGWALPALAVVLGARFAEVDPGFVLAWDEVSWLHAWVLAGLSCYLLAVPFLERLPMRSRWAAPIVAALVVGHLVALGPLELVVVRNSFREQASAGLACLAWARTQVVSMQPPTTGALWWTGVLGSFLTILLAVTPGRFGWFGQPGWGVGRHAVPALAGALWAMSWIASFFQPWALVLTIVMLTGVLQGQPEGSRRRSGILIGLCLAALWWVRPTTPPESTPMERAQAETLRATARLFAKELPTARAGASYDGEIQILAPWQFGSALRFEVGVPAVAVGSHRALGEIQDSWRIYAAPSLQAAEPLLSEHRVRFLVSVARPELLRQVGAAMPAGSLWWALLLDEFDAKRLQVVHTSEEQVSLPLPGGVRSIPAYRVFRLVPPER